MNVRGKRVGTLAPDDIDSLVADRTSESTRLDFKQGSPLGSGNDEARREFLKDVSALANTQGGAILYGVAEERGDGGANTGVAEAILDASFEGLSRDRAVGAVLSCLADGLDPPLRGVEIQVLEIRGSTIFAVGVPRSLDAPHAVSFKRLGRFYRRRGTDNYQVEVAELRAMFRERDDWHTESEAFHQRRLGKVQAGAVDPAFPCDRFTLIHLLPLGRLKETQDVFGLFSRRLLDDYLPRPSHFATMGNQARGTLDGPIIYSFNQPPLPSSFSTLLRSGGIEYATDQFHAARTRSDSFSIGHMEVLLPDLCARHVEHIQRDFGIGPPFALHVSICGARGLTGMVDEHIGGRGGFEVPLPAPFAEDLITIPTAVIESPDGVRPAAAQVVSMIRQAAGGM